MIVFSGLALALSFARCSPLSLSQNKLRSVPGAATPISNTPATPNGNVTPIGGSGLGPGLQASNIINVQASVHEVAQYETETNALPAAQRLSLTADLNADVLEAFKTSRSVIIHFGGRTPDECRAYIGLTMRETAISNFGWNNSTNPITTDCVPQPDGNWKISISASVSQDTWAQLAPNLEGFTIFVANNPQMSVVSSTPGNHPSNPEPQIRITPKH